MNIERMEEALRGEGFEYVAGRYIKEGLGRPEDEKMVANVWHKPGVGHVVILAAGAHDGEAQLFAPARIEDFLTPRDPELPTVRIAGHRYEYEVFVYEVEGGSFYSQERGEYPVHWKLREGGALFVRQFPEPQRLPDGARLLRECEAPLQLVEQLRKIYGRAPDAPLPY